MMAGGVESWSPSPSPPEGRGEGKMVVVGGAMVMDFPLDDSGATAFSSSSSSSPFLRPNCLAGFAGDSRSLSPRRTVLSKISKRSSATPIFAARSLSLSLSLFGVVLGL